MTKQVTRKELGTVPEPKGTTIQVFVIPEDGYRVNYDKTNASADRIARRYGHDEARDWTVTDYQDCQDSMGSYAQLIVEVEFT